MAGYRDVSHGEVGGVVVRDALLASRCEEVMWPQERHHEMDNKWQGEIWQASVTNDREGRPHLLSSKTNKSNHTLGNKCSLTPTPTNRKHNQPPLW